MKNRIISILSFIGIFIFIYVFYTSIHPIVLASGDDWTYVGSSRIALPTLKLWNPAKVFPETIIPQIANISVYLIYPVLGDYVRSFTVTFAFFIAIFITMYIYCFYRYIMSKYSISKEYGIILSMLFLLFHYLIFASNSSNNHYLFEMGVINTFFNYTIPSLINLMLIFYIDSNEKRRNCRYYVTSPICGGAFFLVLYLAAFSNLYCSCLLAIYAGVELLFSALKTRHIITTCKENNLCIIILILWSIDAYFESHGARAATAGESIELSYMRMFYDTSKNVKNMIWSCNKYFLMIAVLCLIAFAIITIKHKGKHQLTNIVLKTVLCFVLSLIFVILLSSFISSYYVVRMDVLLGPAAFVFIAILNILAYLLEKIPHIMIGIPLMAYILIFSFISDSGRTFYDWENPEEYIELDYFYINQFKEADEKMLSEFTLEATSTTPSYFGQRMAKTLYKHGIVSRLMIVETHNNEEVDEMFDLR